jgi:thiamine transport system permease protein
VLAQRWGGFALGIPMLRLGGRRYDGKTMKARLLDAVVIALALALLVPPLAALITAGISRIALSPVLLKAIGTSLALGCASAALSFALVWPLAVLAVRKDAWRKVASLAVLTSWIVPPAALATGWFITLIAYSGLGGLAAFLVIAMNALMSLPFTARALLPALAQSSQAHDRLCLGLGLSGWSRFRLIELPVMKRAIGLALVMALILSLGDLTAISLFGTQDFVTLPALIYRQMGSYRFDEAIGTALVLGLIVLALSTLAERWSESR